jgi:hypothetical protein
MRRRGLEASVTPPAGRVVKATRSLAIVSNRSSSAYAERSRASIIATLSS